MILLVQYVLFSIKLVNRKANVDETLTSVCVRSSCFTTRILAFTLTDSIEKEYN